MSGLRGIEVKDANEHDETAEDRVDDELGGSVDPLRAAPDPNQEVGRDQHNLPEGVEEKQVEGEKDSEHSCLCQ